ncbi:uncharacterized protein LOC116292781 [Actinia tenebrosa]|uniref:Uncharacterized protein LOC116292781 n=1 Tax=Actinia tenebrosa TaxID=6105 RepID=A0A6P8HJI0_ACTTE|nr:uncharacterized protein LOC116292781 [Actinia tenebrosa]
MYSPPYVFYNTNGRVKDNQGTNGIIVDCLLFSFKMCYHSCPSPLNITWKVVNTSNELEQEITSGQSDIILPITSRLVNSLSWPDYTGTPLSFNPIVKTSSRALIINKNHFNQKSMELMLQALLDTWPIFVYTFILAGLSGVCIWILESRGNSDEFQRTFLKGWWEGFWWAFVSMTTVGYGDKTPKSIFGRVFGVIWILVGIVIVAMFTATVTNALTLINSGIENKKVAVLSSTGASIDAINKGTQPIEYGSFQEMYEALESQQVEGIYIDQYVGAHYMKEISDEDLRVLTIVDTEINYLLAVNANTYKEITKNVCVLEALGHTSCDRLLQKYLLPIKSFSFNEDYKGLLSSSSEEH